MELTVFLLVLSGLSVLPSTQAWTFVWRDASGNSYVEHNETAISCTKIRQAQGMRFEWDAEDGPFAISLYRNGECSGRPAGYADHFWDHNVTKALDSLKVDSTAATTSSTSMTTSTSTTTSTTASLPDTTSQSQASPTRTGASSGSGFSGGAITGCDSGRYLDRRGIILDRSSKTTGCWGGRCIRYIRVAFIVWAGTGIEEPGLIFRPGVCA